MSKITDVIYKCIVLHDNTVLSTSADTYKVVALGWCWWEDDMKLVVETHDRSQGSWNMAGFLEENSIWDVKWRGMVFCDGSFYCLGLHHRELRMAIVGFTIPGTDSDRGPMPIPIPMLVAPFPEALCNQVYWPNLVTCGSRLLVVADIYATVHVEQAGWEGKPYRRLREMIVIWELQNDRRPSNSNSISSLGTWKEIARMPPTVFDDLKSFSLPSVEWFKCIGVGDYVCFLPIAICSGQEIKVVVYNLKEGSWIWLPSCYLQNHSDSTLMSMAFQPRPCPDPTGRSIKSASTSLNWL
jgi:hypothetical protein